VTVLAGPHVKPQAEVSAHSRITVTPYSASLGAVIGGVDLGRELDDETTAEIRQALLDHLVIFFRGQEITPEQHLAFARRFGTLNQHDQVKGMEGWPDIIEVRKEPGDERNFGGAWHGDVTYLPEPPLGSILYAREVPEIGGDTLWANCYLAFEQLSPGMRAMIEPLTVMHTPAKIYGLASKDWSKDSSIHSEPNLSAHYETEHPLVRTHPETGRKALYVSGAYTPRFKDMTEEESTPLIDFLMWQCTREPFTCRWRWEKGDIAFWDNRCTLHYALNDYSGHRRVMHRVTINGDRPY
jgi:taurine dioxygenase